MKSIRLFLCAIVLFVGVTASSSVADIIFSNYGDEDAHDNSTGWAALYNPPFGSNTRDWDMGMSFTPIGIDYYLDTIELTAKLDTGSNELDVWLMNDISGEPGAIIEEFHFSGELGTGWGHHDPITATSTLNPILQADSQYWIVISTPVEGSSVSWFQNSIGDTGPRALWDGTDWDIGNPAAYPGVFRVTGEVVPVPGAVLLGMLGLSVVGVKLRKHA